MPSSGFIPLLPIVQRQYPLPVPAPIAFDENRIAGDDVEVLQLGQRAHDSCGAFAELFGKLLVGDVAVPVVALELLNLREDEQVKALEAQTEVILVDGQEFVIHRQGTPFLF